MSRPSLTSWCASPFTGLFTRWGPIAPRPHDPAILAWSGLIPRWGPDGADLAVGGAGVDLAAAEAAALGEAVERWQARPLPTDRIVAASFARWPLDEPSVDPARWVLYHREQYARPGFPFVPMTPESECRWVCCRRAGGGEPWWVPEWLVFLTPGLGQEGDALHPYGPSLSTGLSAGTADQPVLLRGCKR
jgi:ribosomal protein S12 methylthiotransferase accessory factor